MKNNWIYIIGLILSAVLFSCESTQNEPSPEKAVQPTKSSKRGVSYSFRSPSVDSYLLGNSISWFYNWGNSTSDEMLSYCDFYGFEYIPMAWNANYDATKIRQYILTLT